MLLLIIDIFFKIILIQTLEAFYLFSDARVKVKPYNTTSLDLIFQTEGLFFHFSVLHFLTLMLIITPVQTECKTPSNHNSPITSAVIFCTRLAQMQFII